MTGPEIAVLHSLLLEAESNAPGGFNYCEKEVLLMVEQWVIDGIPVRQICPHCGSPAPRGEGRVEFLEDHIDNRWHRLAWNIRNFKLF